MRVGVDVSILSSPLTGIGRFALSLVRALVRVDPSVEWILLGTPAGLAGLPQGPNVIMQRVDGLIGARRLVWQQLALPRVASRLSLDVVHCPDFSRPHAVSVPVVNTIHDLSYYSPEAYFSFPSRLYKRALTRLSVRSSTQLVAVSRFTREQLVRRFGVTAESVPVIYHGADAFPETSSPRADRPFVLYVGTLEDRKNIPTLIEGYTVMRAGNSAPHRLVLAGKPGRGFDRIRAAVRASAFGNDIEVAGYVSAEKVREFYASAHALVMPSVYEGFGLPVLEAMAAGTPVVCSRAASLPEVGGDAVEYFDPMSVDDLAAALSRVLHSDGLRAEMRRKGLARAKQFTWEECARRYCEVYRTVASG